MALLPVAMALLITSKNLLPQKTYVITDGSKVMVHTTASTDCAAVLDEAGLQLDADDTYTTQSADGTAQINVRRGQRLMINYHGTQIEASSAGETVGQLLERLNISCHEEDTLSLPLDAETYDGMELTIAGTVREKQTYTAALPYETIYCSDASLPEGQQRVITAGEAGQVLCEATVTYLNGVEARREILSQQVIEQPVSRIVAVGTAAVESVEESAQPAAVIGEGLITLPTGEVVTYVEKVTCLATAYTCEGYVGTTATGTRARVGAIAVDPEMFPYGTRFYIETKDGEYIYGIATAEDCGDKRFIYDTRLDLYFNTKKECVQFGARSCNVYILG